jgi:hypothetical protein
MIELDADHRRHAVVELAIRDLKAGVGLRHCPSGKFAANAACLMKPSARRQASRNRPTRTPARHEFRHGGFRLSTPVCKFVRGRGRGWSVGLLPRQGLAEAADVYAG